MNREKLMKLIAFGSQIGFILPIILFFVLLVFLMGFLGTLLIVGVPVGIIVWYRLMFKIYSWTEDRKYQRGASTEG